MGGLGFGVAAPAVGVKKGFGVPAVGSPFGKKGLGFGVAAPAVGVAPFGVKKGLGFGVAAPAVGVKKGFGVPAVGSPFGLKKGVPVAGPFDNFGLGAASKKGFPSAFPSAF